MQETRKGDFWGLELHLWPCQHVGFVYFQTWSLISFNLVIFVLSDCVNVAIYKFEILTEKIKARDYLRLCGTVSILLQILRHTYSYRFCFFIWMFVVASRARLLRIWNCDKLRRVREGQVCHSTWLYILVIFGYTFGVFSVSVFCILNLKLWQIKAGEGRTKDRYAIPLSMKCHRGTAQLQLNLQHVPRLFLFVFIERWKAITGHRCHKDSIAF